VNRSRLFAFLGLATALLIFPLFAPTEYAVRIGNIVLIYAMLTLGLNYTVGWTGQISLAQAAFWGVGAYTSAILTARFPLFDPWVAMLIAAGVAGTLGILLGLPTLKIKGHYLALATIGFGEVVQIFFNNSRAVTGGADGISGIPPLSIFGYVLSTEVRMYYLLLIVVVFLVLICVRIHRSTYGRAFIALRDDELAAEVIGISTTMTKTLAFAIGATYAGLAGSFYAHLFRYISPDTFGFEQSLLMLSMLVIGGLGSIAGALVGALIGVALPELLRVFGIFSMSIYTLLVVLVIIFLPDGAAGFARAGRTTRVGVLTRAMSRWRL
jgi:branched-chain amino acid transport system permease protein